MLEIGSKAVDFCLPNQDGVEICLRDLLGKWIVLYFYPKDLTPGCSSEACDFSNSVVEFSKLDSIILGVSADSKELHQKFIDKYSLDITLLSDESKKMIESYGVWQLKKNYGKEYMGIVRSSYIIDPNGIIRAVWKNVKVKGHVDMVKAKLIELGASNV